jgi:hypothetical protein
MGIEIGSGIEIGTGITISPGPSQLRGVLSTAGQAAYDAATVGNFFAVSSTDYANVAAQLSSVTKYVLNDSQMAATPAGGWTAGFAIAYPTSVATVPTGTYIIGFTCRQGGTSGTVTPLISTAFPPTATYNAIANSPTASSLSNQNYFVRKAPTTATAATSYLGLVQSQTAQLNNTSLTGQQGYYAVAGGPPFSSWTSWTASVLFYQVLGTPTQQW